MLELTINDIRLSAEAKDKDEAIALMVDDMVASGLVTPAYLEGMRTRETQTSTFLGNGIAIPHGTPETRDEVKQTGIKVLRFDNGLDWGDGQIAHTVIGIAAKSDEHLTVLRQLTHIIMDDDLSHQLHTTPSPDDVIQILKGEKLEPKLTIDAKAMRLDASVTDLNEAKALAAGIMVANGYLSQAEQLSLMTQDPLSFGEGVWLMTELTEQTQPGVAAVIPEKTARGNGFDLLLAISTQGRSHKALYDRLLQMKRDHQLKQLVQANSGSTLADLLRQMPIEGDSIELRLPIEHGLHARPAAQLAKLIKSFDADVWVTNLSGDGMAVQGTSVARLISLGAAHGHSLRFTVTGTDDSNPILQQLSSAVTQGLGDPVMPLPEQDDSAEPAMDLNDTVEVRPLAAGDELTGMTGAPGMAAGRIQKQERLSFSFSEYGEDTSTELDRFEQALEQLMTQVSARLDATNDSTKTKILAMHLELLNDPELVDGTRSGIRQGRSAEAAWTGTYQSLADQLSLSSDPMLAERADDFKDLGYQLMLILSGQSTESADEPHILVCEEISPSQVAEFDPEVVLAIVTAKGGTTSHAAILARAAGIPLLVGCGEQALTLTDGMPVIVDCDNRLLTVADSDEALDNAQTEIDRRKQQQAKAFAKRFDPAISQDGVRMEVVANISSANDVDKILAQGAEGIGLFRSEFLYMAHTKEPTHAQQVAEYRAARERLGNTEFPLIVRTLDVGGDKPLPYLAMDDEENPFLGVRGARLSLMRPDLLKRQLRALLEAASSGPIRIMFPMISDIQEWRKIRAIYEEVAADYPDVQCEIGMMIEVPSAALMADVFAPELDFFSIGTNDLTQYTLAVDRGHAKLSRQADPIHPAILRLIDLTVKAAEKNGIWVGVCGELAADPFAATLLMGLGVKELSMSSKAIPMVKAAIRQANKTDSAALAAQALQAIDAEGVYQLKPQEA